MMIGVTKHASPEGHATEPSSGDGGAHMPASGRAPVASAAVRRAEAPAARGRRLLMSARAGPMPGGSARDRSVQRAFPGWRWVAVWAAFPVAGCIGWEVRRLVDGDDA